MIPVAVNYNLSDNCSQPTSMLSIMHNEFVNGTGDGNTGIDWQVIDPFHVELRAERAGNGNGRIYSIVVTAFDAN
jgi:hypothetical protein